MNPRSPFSPAAVLGLVGLGTMLFVALLWMISAGMVHGPLNDGGAHGASKGLTGYAALAQLLERQGWDVATGRNEADLAGPGLVVLTPPAEADGRDIARIVDRRVHQGPTLVILPKWTAVPLGNGARAPGAKAGWVSVVGTAPPEWKGFLDQVTVRIAPLRSGRWYGAAGEGPLPKPDTVLSGTGDSIVPVVAGVGDGRMLAGYLADGFPHPALDAMAVIPHQPVADSEDARSWPTVIVFEPDLFNNQGFARREVAGLALSLVRAAGESAPRQVTFDLSLNGFARKPNLLTLAFTPPFVAATLCLLLAALLVGWRAFLRFGPALAGAPALAFGKRQLVANAAGLVRRSKRLHLLGPPYAALVRERLVRALALPHRADPAAREAAIDRALAHRAPGSEPFSAAAARLGAATRPAETLSAAQALHQIERNLER